MGILVGRRYLGGELVVFIVFFLFILKVFILSFCISYKCKYIRESLIIFLIVRYLKVFWGLREVFRFFLFFRVRLVKRLVFTLFFSFKFRFDVMGLFWGFGDVFCWGFRFCIKWRSFLVFIG